MPNWILWLSPVVVSPVLAVLWIAWASRPRRPVEVAESLEQRERFRAALQAPVPQQRSKAKSR